jgi:hypothetical protein
MLLSPHYILDKSPVIYACGAWRFAATAVFIFHALVAFTGESLIAVFAAVITLIDH